MSTDIVLRAFIEDEKDALRDLISLTAEEWEDEFTFCKSTLWQDLKWVRTEKEEEVDFSTKSIYLQVRKYDNGNLCSWYSLPVKDPSPENTPLFPSTLLSPIPQLQNCDLQRAVFFPPSWIVSLGGSFQIDRIIYEDEEGGTEAKFYDVAAANSGWQKLPEMKAARDFPAAVVVDGKIYVFGGLRQCYSNTYVEVYDPESKKWNEKNYDSESLIWDPIDDAVEATWPAYESVPGGGGFFYDENDDRHLLFHSRPIEGLTAMYIFNLETLAIHPAETPFPELLRGAVVVMDGILYAYLMHTEDIRGYDLAKKKWIRGPVAGLDKIYRGKDVQLLHIGGNKLCVIYEDLHIGREEGDDKFWGVFDGKDIYTLRFIVTIFQVQKNDGGGGGLEAKIISSRCFRIPYGVSFDCLVI